MQKNKIILLAFSAISLCSMSAYAMDYYIGAGGGANFLNIDSKVTMNSQSTPDQFHATGGMGSVYFGAGNNWRRYYYGLEAGANYNSAQLKTNMIYVIDHQTLKHAVAKMKMPFNANLNAVLGYKIADNNMLYIILKCQY